MFSESGCPHIAGIAVHPSSYNMGHTNDPRVLLNMPPTRVSAFCRRSFQQWLEMSFRGLPVGFQDTTRESHPSRGGPQQAQPGRSQERHYTVAEIAAMWNLSQDFVRKLFENEPGVLVVGSAASRRSADTVLCGFLNL